MHATTSAYRSNSSMRGGHCSARRAGHLRLQLPRRTKPLPQYQDEAVVFYPGAQVYYGTNTNSITYLGACNGHEKVDLVLEVHRRSCGSCGVSTPWPRILKVKIPSYEKYTFYSGVPAGYRGFIYGAYNGSIEHAGIGAAWTLSPGEAIP